MPGKEKRRISTSNIAWFKKLRLYLEDIMLYDFVFHLFVGILLWYADDVLFSRKNSVPGSASQLPSYLVM